MATEITEMVAPPAVAEEAPQVKPRPFANRNFRLLWVGEGISMFGDQFTLLALPWLVLQLTGSELALGAVLMVAGIPRAVLMLLGGILTDRMAPRTVMLWSNGARLLISLLLLAAVATGSTQLWMLFVLSFAFGVVDAFFHPAFMAIIPGISKEEDLQSSNAIMQGSAMLTQATGPGLAGGLLALIGMAGTLAVDTVTFLVATITLLLMGPTVAPKAQVEVAVPKTSMWAELREMFRFVWNDKLLRALLLISTGLNFFLVGPFMVGPAALAKSRFPEGPAALGWMMSAFSIGSLIGMMGAGVLRPKKMGAMILVFMALGGVCIGLIGVAQTLPAAMVLVGVMGASVGFANILAVTIMQKRIAPEMMGRVMSLVMMASVGVIPISTALAGAVAQFNVGLLFEVCGVMLMITCILGLLNDDLREMAA